MRTEIAKYVRTYKHSEMFILRISNSLRAIAVRLIQTEV
jgi:hypothetical protein